MSRPDQFAAAAAAVSHARRLAREAERHAREALPAEVGEKLKICILDFLACALEAADLPWSRQALSTVVATSPGASIVGAPLKATPADAAFVNAVLGHGLVREDMHVGSISHHGVVVWPVLLAVAQLAPVRGEQLLKAAGLGYQAGARLGRALFTPELARLFRPTGIVAPIGAALAGSHALRLTEDASVAAMAVAANTSSGLNQWPHTGGSEMYFHQALLRATRSRRFSSRLAERMRREDDRRAKRACSPHSDKDLRRPPRSSSRTALRC